MILIEEMVDAHLHTSVSDGELDPPELLEIVVSRVHGPISITDHDAIGAHKRPAVLDRARSLGIELVTGVEMDACHEGVEIHVLGYGLDATDGPLNEFLDSVAAARRQRAREEMAIINGLLGEGTFTDDDIFREGRETLMKPHFIKPLLAKGLFKEYREALKWYRDNVKAQTSPTKPSFRLAAELMRNAGAIIVLAHPGYYIKHNGMDLARVLPQMKEMGLAGVEVYYPYHERSKELFSPAAASEMVEHIRQATVTLGLRITRGTDCHSLADIEESYSRPASTLYY